MLSRLEASLQESKERVRALTQALTQSEDHAAQLQTLSQSQSLQIQQLQDACAQLKSVQEMNEVSLKIMLVSLALVSARV